MPPCMCSENGACGTLRHTMCILTATISTFCVILCTYGRPIDGFPSSHTKVSTPCRVSLVLSHRTVGGDWKDQKMQCPRCGFEMADTKTYCSQCGTVLRNFAPSSPEMEHNIPPSSEYGMQSQAFSYEKLSYHPRITVLRVIRSILYFIAAPIAAFGLIGTFNALFGTSNLFEGLAIFFGLGLLVGSVVIFLRMRDRAPTVAMVSIHLVNPWCNGWHGHGFYPCICFSCKWQALRSFFWLHCSAVRLYFGSNFFMVVLVYNGQIPAK